MNYFLKNPTEIFDVVYLLKVSLDPSRLKINKITKLCNLYIMVLSILYRERDRFPLFVPDRLHETFFMNVLGRLMTVSERFMIVLEHGIQV
jgi:hypothetical protein